MRGGGDLEPLSTSVVIYTPAYFPDYVGGGERLVQLTAAGLRELGLPVVIATRTATGESYELDGIRVVGVPHAREAYDAAHAAPQRGALEALMREQSATVLHSTSLQGLGELAEVAQRCGAQLGLAATEYAVVCPRRTMVRGDGRLCAGPESREDCFRCRFEDRRLRDRLLARTGRRMPVWLSELLTSTGQHIVGRPIGGHLHAWRALESADRVRRHALSLLDLLVLPTHYTRDLVAPHVGTRVCCEAVMHPLAEAIRRHEPKRTPPDVLRVGFVGRALPIKGLHVLVEAASRLLAVTRPRVRVPIELRVFCPLNDGEPGEYSRPLEARVRALPDSEWRWCGVLDATELRAVHAAIDVLVVPSVWPEWLGFVTLEAQGLGTPLVLSAVPSQRELADGDGRSSWFVPPGDAGALAECLTEIWQRKREGALDSPRLLAPTPVEYAAELVRLYEGRTGR